jgi:hypothetical protein
MLHVAVVFFFYQIIPFCYSNSTFDDNNETIEIHLKINNEIIAPNRYSFIITTPFRFIITLPGKNDYQTVRRKKLDLF